MMTQSSKNPNGGGSATVIVLTIIGIVIATIIGVIQIRQNEQKNTPVDDATPTTVTLAQPPPPSTAPSVDTEAPVPPAIRTTRSSQTPAPPATLERFDITIKGLSGSRVGPNLFQLGGARLGIAWDWQGIRTDGTQDSSDNCQIIVNVSGAQTFPAQRFSECSERAGSAFSGPKNAEEFTVPGDYSVTVTDEITGATGQATFRVLG